MTYSKQQLKKAIQRKLRINYGITEEQATES